MQTKVGKLLFALALCSGLGVANVYYLQPGLALVQDDFHITSAQAGLVPTLTQIGYALGMLLLAPLGDIVAWRKLILWKAGLMVLALLLAACAPTLAVLAAAGAMTGVLGSMGQDYIPLAAQLAPAAGRGKAVGTVTTGLLTGILLSRALGGWVAQVLSWRDMQLIAAAMMVMVAAITWSLLPSIPPATKSRYGSLLTSLWTLWRTHRALRVAVLTQAVLAVTLGAFWSSLSIVLAGAPFHQRAGVAGAYGFAGAAGALAAPLFGGFADRSGPLPAVRVGGMLVVLAFAGLMILPPSLWTLALCALLFDLGVMAALVSHQSIVNGIDAGARSRLNGLLMTGAMCGMALGAAMGSWALQKYGPHGLWTVGIVAGASGLMISFFHEKKGGDNV
jgi:predicted MFS family arabinose efflux permease